MKLPPLNDDELQAFLREGLWVAKIATHNPDESICMTPLTYAVDDNGDVLFTTWQNNDAVAISDATPAPRCSSTRSTSPSLVGARRYGSTT